MMYVASLVRVVALARPRQIVECTPNIRSDPKLKRLFFRPLEVHSYRLSHAARDGYVWGEMRRSRC
jgi:hypothetical protein